MLIRDAVAAAALLAVGAAEVLGLRLADDVVQGPVLLNLLTVAAYAAPVAFRSSQPVLSLCAVHLSLGLRAAVGPPLELYVPLFAGVLTAWSVGARARPLPAGVGVVVAAFGLTVAQARGTGGEATPDAVATLVLLATVAAVARVVGVRLASSSAQLARSHELDAQRLQREAAAVLAERTRIARELHDAVSHSLSMITMQAGGAQDVVADDPERARQSLHAIEQAARAGLGEMRQLLGLLHDSGSPPGFANAAELVARARATGLHVRWAVTGEQRPLLYDVDAAAYRVLQEALTNATRHGAGDGVDLNVHYGTDELRIRVVNALGRKRSAGGSGYGISGMRDRVEALGGAVECLTKDGRFELTVALPLGKSP